MISWLKDKFRRWLSEKIARAYQEMHTQRMQKMTKNLPRELVGINKVLETLNNNSWAVHHLFKKARNKKQYANAFLYFFYSFELTLKHLIISEMNLKNMEATIASAKNGLNFFSVYSEKEMTDILDLGPTGKVIKKFLEIFTGYNRRNDLWKINGERNNIIHDMLKKEMSEASIEKSFEDFFSKTASAIKNIFEEFDSIFAKRPEKFLEKLTQTLGQNPMIETGQASP